MAVFDSCLRIFVYLLLLTAKVGAPINERETVHDDPFVAYPFRLTCTSSFGRIDDRAHPGSEVPVDTTLPHFQNREESIFLRLELYRNIGYSEDNETTASSQRLMPMPYLPAGLMIDISDEEGTADGVDERLSFAVDENLHIVVDNPYGFNEVDEIGFWVVTIQRQEGKNDEVVSNPLAFVIKIDHPALSEDQTKAVYVGIVVFVVCLIVLLIPLTVRTKRRMREGKPICACGSSAQKLSERRLKEIKAKSAKFPETNPLEESTLAVIYQGRPRAPTGPAHETFQSHNLRSLSDHHFQPRWLDPHYKDVYERPVFTQAENSSSSPVTIHSNDASSAVSSISKNLEAKL